MMIPRFSRSFLSFLLAPRSSRGRCGWSDDSGAVTAEYAVATLAAVGFAGVLVVVLRSDEVRTVLLDLIRGALTGG